MGSTPQPPLGLGPGGDAPRGSGSSGPSPGATAVPFPHDRYELVSELGQGAMGRVYRARHRLMHRDVAVKVLHAEVSSRPEVVGRFRQEAQAGAMLDHPNLCAALDFGELEDGSFFFVMEYLDGPNLASVIEREGPLPAERAVHLGRQIAAGLGAAHAAGIIHRDLKPDNVVLMSRPDGSEQVKILDFGIAKVTTPTPEGAVKLTAVGAICGTPAYMAPEQAVAGTVDLRSDLYSLGVVLYEMVTGVVPFEADDVWDTLRMHMAEAPMPPRKVAPDAPIPRALERVILRLLEKSPDDRYQSAAEVEQALAGVWAEDAAGATGRVLRVVREQVGQVAGDTSQRGRRKRWAAAGAAAAVVAVVAVVAALSVRGGGDGSHGAATDTTAGATGASRGGSEARPSAGEEALRALRAAREKLAQRGDVRPAIALLARGEFADASTALGPVVGRSPDDPHAQRLLAEARAGLGDHFGALTAFLRAQDLDPRYGWDPAAALQAMVVLGATHADAQTIQLAQRVLRSSRATTVVREGLERLARDSLAPPVRARAAALLRELHLLSALPEASRLLIELNTTQDCEARRPLVVRLGETGDARALAALKAMGESRSGCGPTGQDDCHACLRPDLARAIRTLRGALDKGATPSAPSARRTP